MLSCQNSKNESVNVTQELANGLPKKKDTIHNGRRLMQISCIACHSATADQTSRLAPPMIAVKRRYLLDYPSKVEFTQALRGFLKNPSEEKAIMYGAVKRFGVMPKTVYPEKVIDQISDYLYDNEIEKPEWFEEHFQENHEKRAGMAKKGN